MEPSSVQITTSEPRSSVEVTTNTKGEALLTIKVYDDDVRAAMDTCIKLYKNGKQQLDALKVKDTTNA